VPGVSVPYAAIPVCPGLTLSWMQCVLLCKGNSLTRTSKVGAICQLGLLIAFGEDAHHPVLDEVHLLANGALPYDIIPRLKHLEPQLGQHRGHKVGICIGKEGHGGNQLPAVEVYDFLTMM